MRTVTDGERRARLGIRHALASPVSSVEEAVRSVVCLHATEPANAYLSVFARCGAGQDEIGAAFYRDRSVIRQLAMRRTVFAVPRDLLAAVRGSASARVAAQIGARLALEVAACGLAGDGAAWVADVCAQTLAAIRQSPATTAQLRGTLPQLDLRLPLNGRAGDSPVAPRLLAVLAADGSVVRGENAGGWRLSRPVWTSVEEWLGEDPGATGSSQGYAELVRRWLLAFGPGTEADLTWWLGATKGAVRKALLEVGAVEAALEDGTPAWLHPEDTGTVAPPGPWAALLPALDPSTMGWQRRGFYLGDHAERIFDRNGNGGPTAWWNGQIVGGWTQREDGSVAVVPAAPLPEAAAAALDDRAAQLTRWLDGEVVRTVYQSPLVRGMASG